ncbi:MAG TPA: sigma 54-interacting transcriptional regulator [Candidatus Acidoferrales bacterium]|nr:sigma 54-interacting transcriptional regulator [Candidatus Acidoferrales bacterium]
MSGGAQAGSASERLRALVEVSQAILQHRDLADLLADLAVRLAPVAPFEFLALVLHDEATGRMRLHLLRSPGPPPEMLAEGLPVAESPSGAVWQTQQPMVFPDLNREDRFPALLPQLRGIGIRSLCLLPLTTAQRRLGAMAFATTRSISIGEAEIGFLGDVARQVALALDNTLHHQEAQWYQRQLAHQRDRLRALLELTNAVVSRLDLRELFAEISSSLRQLFHCEFASLSLYEPETHRMRIQALDFPEGKGLIREEHSVAADASPAGQAFLRRQPLLLGSAELQKFGLPVIEAEGLRSVLCLPLIRPSHPLGTLNLASLRESAFSQEDVDFLSRVADQIAIAVENALAYRQIERQKNRLAEEKLYLENEISAESGLDEIVGESPAWRRAVEQVRTVAPTDSTVLLLGETGTGKELLARLTHQLSPRRDRTFIKLNCSAIPSGLLESELFGHERGAFTGAIGRRMGRFELADQGTLFLDEIGDIPLELQPKLLRVLQERQFERLGGGATLRVDVRLVVATNRNLAAMVASHAFRSDLYYRVNVFPVHVPPLRERRGDIPLLARYFAQKHAALADKKIETVPREAIEAMTAYRWPGNVRELENFIERAVILSPGTALRVPLAELRAADGPAEHPESLQNVEREHIRRVLEETRWRIGGPNGAAARLGMKRTTLQSRMHKLALRRPE